MTHEAEITYRRLKPRLDLEFKKCDEDVRDAFMARLDAHWARLFDLLFRLYGTHYDFYFHLEQLLSVMGASWRGRAPELRALDIAREENPNWFESEKMLGGVCYVDLYAGDLNGIRKAIPYFQELGLTYLHLMPLFKAPEGNSDGGYAVSNYREVSPTLGTMKDLHDLAGELRAAGISLVLDFVFNHTSDEHEWARRAKRRELEYREYYFLFPDRELPDAYEQTLREIFPTVRRGSFTWVDEVRCWVWTTFNSFQWDLNYSNPAVFVAMAAEMLFLANQGVEILRLDAVAFIWKRLGTSCENLPEAHMIIQAMNCIARIAAPALVFKSEAIVHPDDVLSYISQEECQISYNPLLMALLWEAIATRETKLLSYSMSTRFALPEGCAWVNYLRSHDDIGWTFDDEDARRVGIDPQGHRRFLNDFYIGRFPGTFARGLPFQENPDTGDARVSGTLASLAGLEAAIHANDEQAVQLAVRRIVMLHSIILSIGGIPLIYLGDELGMLNDYSYSEDPARAEDSRWVHRPHRVLEGAENSTHPGQVAHRIFEQIMRLVKLRKAHAVFSSSRMDVIATGSPRVFGYVRHHSSERLLVLANVADYHVQLSGDIIRTTLSGYRAHDLISGNEVDAEQEIELEPYQFLWLRHT